MMKYLATLGLACMLSNTGSAQVRPSVVYVVQQQALNKFASAMGSLSGDAGYYTLTGTGPCFPWFWQTCTYTLYGGEVYWTLSNAQFSVSPAGILLRGALTTTWGGLPPYSTTVTAGVNVAFNATSSALSVTVGQVSVPITFLGLTVTTVTFSPNYSLQYPIATTTIVPLSGTPTITVLPQNGSVTLGNGQLAITAEVATW